MNYDQALEYIHNTNKFGIKLGLDNIAELLSRLGNPHKEMKFVHIAGTNGKGSVTTYICSVLERAGYKVGEYISPFIRVFNERISVNSAMISDDELAMLTQKVKCAIENMVRDGHNHPTEFEIVTAIAMLYYHAKKCDIVVLEVGLGGRFDSTNIIDTPEVAVITPISIDHEKYLGDTLEKIAYEKAGIIKKNTTVVSAKQSSEAENVLINVANAEQAKIEFVDNSLFKEQQGNILDGGTFVVEYSGSEIEVHVELIGEHQLQNAKLAFSALKVLAAKGWNISADDIKTGFLNARWPGRLEILSRNPLTIIDGAHNPAGAEALYKAITEIKKFKQNLYVIIGVMADKDVESIIDKIIPIADKVYAVTPDNPRAMPAKQLKTKLEKYNSNVESIDSPLQAFEQAKANAGAEDIVLAYGSLYYIGLLK